MQLSEPHGTGVATARRQRGRPWLSRRLADRRALPVLVVGMLTVIGLSIRLVVAQEAMYGDELSTWWIIGANGLGGVVSTVHTDAEITPPFFFVLSWLTTQIDFTPELARAPSLVAGTACIPLTYLLGLRTVGRPAALVATALTTLSPFLIYYAAEARGYALMMFLVVLSTLAMLEAVDSRRARWWVLYAVCSCLAMYTHYTSAFALAPQLLWLLWAHQEARRPALLANVAAALAFAPWLSGVQADFDSWTTKILDQLNPFNWESVWISFSHAAIGYPYRTTGLSELPGTPGSILFVLALLIAIAGVAVRALGKRREAGLGRPHPRLVLVIAIAVAVPAGEAIATTLGTNVFGGRNLIPGLPAFMLCLGALLVAPGPRLRLFAVGLALACFAVGAAMMLGHQRPQYRAVAEIIDDQAAPGDVVVDGAALTPGPYSPLDLALERSHTVIRSGTPEQRERPFGLFDRRVPTRDAVTKSIAAADGNRIYVVSIPGFQPGLRGSGRLRNAFRARYRVVESHRFTGSVNLILQVWADKESPQQ